MSPRIQAGSEGPTSETLGRIALGFVGWALLGAFMVSYCVAPRTRDERRELHRARTAIHEIERVRDEGKEPKMQAFERQLYGDIDGVLEHYREVVQEAEDEDSALRPRIGASYLLASAFALGAGLYVRRRWHVELS